MREYQAKDMLFHEYSEYEWQDAFSDDEQRDHYLKQCTERARDLGLRYFNVLVKPADELLSDAKPSTPFIIDTWRVDAREKATELLYKYGEANMHHTAILALFARLAGASIEYEYSDGAHNLLLIPILGMGTMKCLVPKGLTKDLFDLPENHKQFKGKVWETVDILEHVFLKDRQNGKGA